MDGETSTPHRSARSSPEIYTSKTIAVGGPPDSNLYNLPQTVGSDNANLLSNPNAAARRVAAPVVTLNVQSHKSVKQPADRSKVNHEKVNDCIEQDRTEQPRGNPAINGGLTSQQISAPVPDFFYATPINQHDGLENSLKRRKINNGTKIPPTAISQSVTLPQLVTPLLRNPEDVGKANVEHWIRREFLIYMAKIAHPLYTFASALSSSTGNLSSDEYVTVFPQDIHDLAWNTPQLRFRRGHETRYGLEDFIHELAQQVGQHPKEMFSIIEYLLRSHSKSQEFVRVRGGQRIRHLQRERREQVRKEPAIPEAPRSWVDLSTVKSFNELKKQWETLRGIEPTTTPVTTGPKVLSTPGEGEWETTEEEEEEESREKEREKSPELRLPTSTGSKEAPTLIRKSPPETEAFDIILNWRKAFENIHRVDLTPLIFSNDEEAGRHLGFLMLNPKIQGLIRKARTNIFSFAQKDFDISALMYGSNIMTHFTDYLAFLMGVIGPLKTTFPFNRNSGVGQTVNVQYLVSKPSGPTRYQLEAHKVQHEQWIEFWKNVRSNLATGELFYQSPEARTLKRTSTATSFVSKQQQVVFAPTGVTKQRTFGQLAFQNF